VNKEALIALTEAQQNRLFDLACQIFDCPETALEEFFASKLLADDLENQGFTVERGVGELPTAFRAVWKNGEGGPNIGILGEYDALPGKGHACGHHLQTPGAIGAAVAIKKLFEGTDIPFTLTVYGTPAEESKGGKILMIKQGCFRELDVVLASHATRVKGFVSTGSYASSSYTITFHGKSAHAAGSPWQGRSAMDAMILAFQGIEFMREHVKEGTRMHYSIAEAIGPSNVVPAKAVCTVLLRSKDNSYIPELVERLRKVVKGACLMTETTADFQYKNAYMARKPNDTLGRVCLDNYAWLGIPIQEPPMRSSGGSSDVGNVSTIVPTAGVYIPYVDSTSHSDLWVENGKSEKALSCMMGTAKILAGVTYDLLTDPEIIKKAKKEFDSI